MRTRNTQGFLVTLWWGPAPHPSPPPQPKGLAWIHAGGCGCDLANIGGIGASTARPRVCMQSCNRACHGIAPVQVPAASVHARPHTLKMLNAMKSTDHFRAEPHRAGTRVPQEPGKATTAERERLAMAVHRRVLCSLHRPAGLPERGGGDSRVDAPLSGVPADSCGTTPVADPGSTLFSNTGLACTGGADQT